MTKELFGTDGIRGIPGTYPLDDATLYGVARALGKYLLEIDPKPRVLIGMDTRESGPWLAEQVAGAIALPLREDGAGGVHEVRGDQAADVHQHDGRRLRRERGGQCLRAQRESHRVDIGEDGPPACPQGSLRSREECIRGHYDITPGYADAAQNDLKRSGPAGDGN